jgi:hypothetical protein
LIIFLLAVAAQVATPQAVVVVVVAYYPVSSLR